MLGRLHTITTDALTLMWQALSSFVDWAGDVALSHRCRWGVQWVLAVVKWLWDVVGSSDAMEVEGGWSL